MTTETVTKKIMYCELCRHEHLMDSHPLTKPSSVDYNRDEWPILTADLELSTQAS